MSEVFELRQYTLHPGARETLIELFEREFIRAQEATGMSVPGHFRDLGDPNRFVWIRGFADMPSRKEALTRFYDSESWRLHRDAANATMIDWNDVLLLRFIDESRGFPAPDGERPLHVTVFPFDASLLPLAVLQSEHSENNYPRLPVREENVLVTMTREPVHASVEPLQRLVLEPAARSRLR